MLQKGRSLVCSLKFDQILMKYVPIELNLKRELMLLLFVLFEGVFVTCTIYIATPPRVVIYDSKVCLSLQHTLEL